MLVMGVYPTGSSALEPPRVSIVDLVMTIAAIGVTVAWLCALAYIIAAMAGWME